ncbi:MAG: hypothetical protein EA359_16945 [Balneolaceae bacterium]|nr:MAG: hypothetical protein EA359_16945 [Balneolaceae bacterium]
MEAPLFAPKNGQYHSEGDRDKVSSYLFRELPDGDFLKLPPDQKSEIAYQKSDIKFELIIKSGPEYKEWQYRVKAQSAGLSLLMQSQKLLMPFLSLVNLGDE